MKLISFLICAAFLPIYGIEYYSQDGQEKWVIEEALWEKENGFFVDIGAADGVVFSNTLTLEKYYGWRGICIEASPYYYNGLVKNRKSINVRACLDYTNHQVSFINAQLLSGIVDQDTDNQIGHNSRIVKVQTRTLEQVLDECQAPHVIDFLSIDVEGAEQRIFKNFPFEKYIFLAMVIERPKPELHEQLLANGYVFVKRAQCDLFYVHASIPNFDKISKETYQYKFVPR